MSPRRGRCRREEQISGERTLNTRVPVQFLRRGCQSIPFEVRILLEPLLQLDDFQRISGSHQNLRQQRALGLPAIPVLNSFIVSAI
jgi:hypothetical protein